MAENGELARAREEGRVSEWRKGVEKRLEDVDELEARIEKLERWRSWALGAAAGIGALLAWFGELLSGQRR